MRRSGRSARRPAARRWPLVPIALALALSGAGLSACTTPKNALGTTSSPCFRALPVAHQAVNGSGTLLGVRYLTAKTIDADLQRTNQREALVAPVLAGVKYPVCTVGYEGHFVASRLPKPWPPGRDRSRYVLVLVDLHHDTLLAVVLLVRLPLRLSKI